MTFHPWTSHLDRDVSRFGLQQPSLQEVRDGLAGVQLLVAADLGDLPGALRMVEIGEDHLLLMGESGAAMHLALSIQHRRDLAVDVEVEGLGPG